jgi:hypothetical protein
LRPQQRRAAGGIELPGSRVTRAGFNGGRQSSTEMPRAHIAAGSALMRIADLVPKTATRETRQDVDALAV